MATWTKTYKETSSISGFSKSTWTLVMTAPDSYTFNTDGPVPRNISLTAKYSAANNRNGAEIDSIFCTNLTGFDDPDHTFLQGDASFRGGWSANTAKSLHVGGQSEFYPEFFFGPTNKTSKTVTVPIKVEYIRAYTFYTRYGSQEVAGDLDYEPSSPVSWGNVTFTLNTPPICNGSFTSFSSGYANFSCSAEGKYDADISSMSISVNGQTGSATSIGSNEATRTISVPITAHGKFTPILTVTDSRTLTATKSLAEINVYSPSVVFNCERANSDGTPSDDGESYAVITANFNWLDSVTTLAAPTLTVTDIDDATITTSVTWYTTRSADGTLSDPISSWDSISSSSMPVYGLVSGNFNSQQSYKVRITPNDALGAGITNLQMLNGAFYTIDFLAGGHGIAFGMPATDDGFHCGMDAHFYNMEGNDGVVSVHLEPRDAYDWNIDHAPADNAYGTGFEIYDSAGHRITNLDVHAYPNGTIATVLGAHRKINDEDIYHQIYLYIDDDGTTSYGISNAAAFRKAIELDVTTATCTPASGWAHYSDVDALRVRKMGNVVTFCGALKNTSQISCNSLGNSSFQMTTIPSGYRPSQNVTFLCQGSGAAVWLCRIYKNGAVCMERYRLVLQTTNPVTITAGTWFPISATWIME